ncbi:MAG: methyltransferase domain-containing protein [Bryobacteraceae bacterium]
MSELLKAIRLMGPTHMVKLGRAYKTGWDEMIRGYVATQAVHAILSVGLLDELQKKESVDIPEFARERKLELPILLPVCEALYSMGILDRSGHHYKLADRSASTIEVLRGWLEISFGYAEVFNDLEKMIKGERVYAKDFYRKSDWVATGSGEMEHWLFFPMVNDILKARNAARVVDLGCGDATFLRELCGINADVHCFGIDLAATAIEEGQRRNEAAGLANRITLQTGNICDVDAIPASFKTAQAATIFFILHEILYQGEQALIDFLKGFQRSFPGVPLIAFEAVRPTAEEMREHQGIAIYYYLYHELTQQKPVSRERWKSLFHQAGFTNVEERFLSFSHSAVYTLSQ